MKKISLLLLSFVALFILTGCPTPKPKPVTKADFALVNKLKGKINSEVNIGVVSFISGVNFTFTISKKVQGSNTKLRMVNKIDESRSTSGIAGRFTTDKVGTYEVTVKAKKEPLESVIKKTTITITQ